MMGSPSHPQDARPHDPLADLRGLPQAELERRARVHLQGLQKEVADLKTHVEQNFHPSVMARKHPLVVAGLGTLLGLWLMRKLRGRRPTAVKNPVEAADARSPKHVFRRSLLSGLAKTAGTALPALLVWGIKRHAGAQTGRSGKPRS